eukprot:jgi/Mesvir1/17193/Mv07613-RA.1
MAWALRFSGSAGPKLIHGMLATANSVQLPVASRSANDRRIALRVCKGMLKKDNGTCNNFDACNPVNDTTALCIDGMHALSAAKHRLLLLAGRAHNKTMHMETSGKAKTTGQNLTRPLPRPLRQILRSRRAVGVAFPPKSVGSSLASIVRIVINRQFDLRLLAYCGTRSPQLLFCRQVRSFGLPTKRTGGKKNLDARIPRNVMMEKLAFVTCACNRCVQRLGDALVFNYISFVKVHVHVVKAFAVLVAFASFSINRRRSPRFLRSALLMGMETDAYPVAARRELEALLLLPQPLGPSSLDDPVSCRRFARGKTWNYRFSESLYWTQPSKMETALQLLLPYDTVDANDITFIDADTGDVFREIQEQDTAAMTKRGGLSTAATGLPGTTSRGGNLGSLLRPSASSNAGQANASSGLPGGLGLGTAALEGGTGGVPELDKRVFSDPRAALLAGTLETVPPGFSYGLDVASFFAADTGAGAEATGSHPQPNEPTPAHDSAHADGHPGELDQGDRGRLSAEMGLEISAADSGRVGDSGAAGMMGNVQVAAAAASAVSSVAGSIAAEPTPRKAAPALSFEQMFSLAWGGVDDDVEAPEEEEEEEAEEEEEESGSSEDSAGEEGEGQDEEEEGTGAGADAGAEGEQEREEGGEKGEKGKGPAVADGRARAKVEDDTELAAILAAGKKDLFGGASAAKKRAGPSQRPPRSKNDSRNIRDKLRKQEDGVAEKEEWAVEHAIPNVHAVFPQLVPRPARHYKFELDIFQKEAVIHMERGDNVFVTAHTSAGKTVVAEYALALATKHCTRAVYTSPIKTISNQKFRDFTSDGFDVGLLTGDVSIKPEAPCLIMTTEILRSMLYRGADMIRDIEWVIFDEVHYLNDPERGVVWEEVIIMLPEHISMVLLSATVPNATEFANWIGRTKQRKIYVTGTRKRPVPLEHHLYYHGQMYKICDHNTQFLPAGHKAALEAQKKRAAASAGPGGGGARGGGRGGGGGGGGGYGQTTGSNASVFTTLLAQLKKENLLPAVIFAFSRRKCDECADNLSGLDLCDAREKSEIHHFFDLSLSRLKGTDRQLPQVLRLRELLKRGIGVHHAGLLPIVKEVVEMLFCRGVIKVLFSTETFAMGVNAPARTVVFNGLRKHDGKAFRMLLPGEYTQMAGRAGRRGLDTVGTVVNLCWDEVPPESDMKNLLVGKATKLESQFRLTYNMILNVLRTEDLKMEDMLKRSFAEFHAQKALPKHRLKLAQDELALNRIPSMQCIVSPDPPIPAYVALANEANSLGSQLLSSCMNTPKAQQMLVPGRVVLVNTAAHTIEPALVTHAAIGQGRGTRGRVGVIWPICARAVSPTGRVRGQGGGFEKDGFVAIKGKKGGLDDEWGSGGGPDSGPILLPLPHVGEVGGVLYEVARVSSEALAAICKMKEKVVSRDIVGQAAPKPAALAAAVTTLAGLGEKYPQGPPVADASEDFKLKDLESVSAYTRHSKLLEQMAASPCHRCPKLPEHYATAQARHVLLEHMRKLRAQLSDDNLRQLPDFQARVQVLRRLGYLAPDDTVQLKGRVACEMNTGDELISTEMIFDNQLDALTPEEAVAILSSLVFQAKDADEPTSLPPRLKDAQARLLSTALYLGEVQHEAGLREIAPREYVRGALRFGLVEVVHEWALGTPFAEICTLTNVPEGTIVRTIVRLDETCREFRDAARVIGNAALYRKMEEASACIKRDIVFAASLYVVS